MTVVIGTDEAGYGPNLGPLVVAGTAWRVSAGAAAVEAALAAAAELAADRAGGRLWGDSKRIYRSGGGLAALGRGVLVATALADGGQTATDAGLAAALDPVATPGLADTGASAATGHPHASACRELAAVIRPSLAGGGIALEAVRCRVIEPAEFNARLDRGSNKSDILCEVTLDLAATLAAAAGDGEAVVIWCDRHGGRRRYAQLVARAFATPLVQPLDETPRLSRYRFGADRLIEFSVGGEERLPVAVASMTAKYVRELAMLAFNDFWQRRQPGLAATAGYPVDAARWRREAAAAVEAAGIPWDSVWRRL